MNPGNPGPTGPSTPTTPGSPAGRVRVVALASGVDPYDVCLRAKSGSGVTGAWVGPMAKKSGVTTAFVGGQPTVIGYDAEFEPGSEVELRLISPNTDCSDANALATQPRRLSAPAVADGFYTAVVFGEPSASQGLYGWSIIKDRDRGTLTPTNVAAVRMFSGAVADTSEVTALGSADRGLPVVLLNGLVGYVAQGTNIQDPQLGSFTADRSYLYLTGEFAKERATGRVDSFTLQFAPSGSTTDVSLMSDVSPFGLGKMYSIYTFSNRNLSGTVHGMICEENADPAMQPNCLR